VNWLVDPNAANSRAMQASFRRATIDTDLTSLWTHGSPDLTLVLSPAHLHSTHSIAALEHNSHVLCEKPMATTVADCDQMLAAARRMDRVLAVGMIRRYFPAFASLAHLVHSGELGKIQSFDYREGKQFDWDVTTPAAFQRRFHGGAGVLFDIGPHAIDLLGWLFGTSEVLFYADDALSGIESNVAMELQLDLSRGRVNLSWDSPLSNELRVFGSKAEAVLRLDCFDRLAVSTSSQFTERRTSVSFPADIERPCRVWISPTDYHQAMYCQLIQTVRAIRLHEAPAVDEELGRHCVSVMEKALSIARPLDTPWLSTTRQAAFRGLHWTSTH
jgi:predicted dehydrogenase